MHPFLTGLIKVCIGLRQTNDAIVYMDLAIFLSFDLYGPVLLCLAKQCVKFSAIFIVWNAIYWEYSSLSPFLTPFHPQCEVCKSVLYFELSATK